MIDYGTEKATFQVDDSGSTLTTIQKFRHGETERTIRQYKIKVKVSSTQEEMAEFIRFIEEVARHRANKTLTLDREDPSTRPAFIIEYPRENIDGGYFIIKSYSILG